MSQQNLTAAKKFLIAIDKWRDLSKEWEDDFEYDEVLGTENNEENEENEARPATVPPHQCSSQEELRVLPPSTPPEQWRRILDETQNTFSREIDPDLWKAWKETCSAADNRYRSIIEELTLHGPAAIRLVNAHGGDSKKVYKWFKKNVEYSTVCPWDFVTFDQVSQILKHHHSDDLVNASGAFSPAYDESLLLIGHAVCLAEQANEESGKNDLESSMEEEPEQIIRETLKVKCWSDNAHATGHLVNGSEIAASATVDANANGADLEDDALQILETMEVNGIISRRARITRQEIVRLINPKHNALNYSHDFSDLKKKGYTDSTKGPNGGIWLTTKGKDTAKLNSADAC